MQLSRTNKQVVILYISTFVGTALGVLVSILNTRNLSPENYGDVRYVTNLLSLFSGIFLLGYFVSGSRLLAIAKNKEEASQIKGVLFVLLSVLAGVIMASMLVCGLIHQFFLQKPCYHLFYVVIPVCGNVILLSYINTTCQGDNNITAIAMARLLPSVLYLAVGFIVYGLFGCSSRMMLLLQNGVYTAALIFVLYTEHPIFKNLKQRWKQLRDENKSYGLHVYYGSLSNVSVQYIAGLTLGLFSLDNQDVGFYSLSLTVAAPLAMLPNIIGTTYFKQFAHQHSIGSKILGMTFLMSIVSYSIFCVIIFPVVSFLYDASYGVVAKYACFLALGSTLTGLGDVYNRFLGVHGQGKQIRNCAFASGAIQIVGYTLGVYLLGIGGAIATYILSATAAFGMLVIYYKKFIK